MAKVTERPGTEACLFDVREALKAALPGRQISLECRRHSGGYAVEVEVEWMSPPGSACRAVRIATDLELASLKCEQAWFWADALEEAMRRVEDMAAVFSAREAA